MKYDHLTIGDLQRFSRAGDEEAMKALGERIMWITLIDADHHDCRYRDELADLQDDLDREIPEDCPKCGAWLTKK